MIDAQQPVLIKDQSWGIAQTLCLDCSSPLKHIKQHLRDALIKLEARSRSALGYSDQTTIYGASMISVVGQK